MSNAKAIAKAVTATLGLILFVGLVTASAQTSQFVSMMRNARVFFADGSASAPSIAFANSTGTGLWSPAANTLGITTAGTAQVRFVANNIVMRDSLAFGWSSTADPQVPPDTILCRGAANVIGIGGCTSSFPALKRSATGIQIRLADDSGYAPFTASNVSFTSGVFPNGTTLLLSASAPTIGSGFGTSPSIVASNGASTFRLNVGTGGVATSGVVTMPTASNGWNCTVQDMTNNTATRQTASTTTSVTFTAAAAWAASDILLATCFAY